MESLNGYEIFIIIGSVPRVTRCSIWQLGFRVITLGELSRFTPRVPKRAVEDQQGQISRAGIWLLTQNFEGLSCWYFGGK